MKMSVILVVVTVIAVVAAAGQNPALEDQITTEAGPLTVHPVEHATFVMGWGGKTIAVDATKCGTSV